MKYTVPTTNSALAGQPQEKDHCGEHSRKIVRVK